MFIKFKKNHHNQKIHGANDQKVSRAFVWNRSLLANQWILLATPIMVLGLGMISYAAFALSLNSPAGYIDYPGNGAVIGGSNQYIAGWAVAASAVDHVDIVVNGVAARASYGTGGARPDVCASYPQSPNCANANMVGWQYYFNSNGMPNGTYSLYSNIYGSAGGFTSTPLQYFTVNNQPPAGYIDTPASGQVVSGTINVGGWGIDSASYIEQNINSITMSIDALPTVYYPIYGYARADVCASYPGRPNCPNVGFNYSLDTTLIPNGAHTMYITLYDNDIPQRSTTLSQAFTVSNTGPPPVITGPGTNPGGGGGDGGGTPTTPTNPTAGGNGYLDGFIDDPKPAAKIPPNPYSGTMTLDGWAVGVKTVVNSVKIYIDGSYVVAAHYPSTTTRTDVCSNHAGWFNCPIGYIGWSTSYDTNKLTNGSHTVRAVIDDGDYPTHPYSTPTVSFTVKNAISGGTTTPPTSTTNLPPDVYIDGITSDGVMLNARGWAIDNKTKAESAVTKVVAAIDGQLISTVLTGQSRTDVCANYPSRAGCPNVGWTTSFDPANLTAGQHVFSVTATDASGMTRTATAGFITTGGEAGDCGPGAQTCSGGGSTRSVKDRAVGSTSRIHILYVVPSGGPDRGLDKNGAIVRTMTGVQSWLKGQSGTTFRLDTYGGITDVTFVALPYTNARYKSLGATGLINTLTADVNNQLAKQQSQSVGFEPGKKYMAFFEGGGDFCGDAGIGGSLGVYTLQAAQVSPKFSCNDTNMSRGTAASSLIQKLVAHEILHTLGAVQGGSACAHFSGNHVTDTNDLMNSLTMSTAVLDVGGDSYWGNNVKAGCFNVKN